MTQSRTHYIPVSGITIDTIKDAIGDILPGLIDDAVGDILNPPPATYCPANGYFPTDFPTYEPPIDTVPEPAEGEVILLCSNEGQAAVSVYAMPAFTVTVYNDLNEEVFSINQGSGATYTYSFPKDGGLKYYIVKIKGQSSGLTRFRRGSVSGNANNWSIIEAIINAPLLQHLSGGFMNVAMLKKCTMMGSYNSLITMDSMFQLSGIETFTFPSSLPSLATVFSMFLQSEVISIVCNTHAPQLTTMASFASKCMRLNAMALTITGVPPITTFQDFISYCPSLKTLDASGIVTYNTSTTNKNISYFAKFCPNIENIKTPAINHDLKYPYIVTEAFDGCFKLRSITFCGSWSISRNDNALRDCFSLEELIYGTTEFGDAALFTYPPTISYAKNFKKIRLPDTWTAGNTSDITPAISQNIEEVTGCTVGFSAVLGVGHLRVNSAKLHTVNLPLFAPTAVSLGAPGAPITEVIIDWANKTRTVGHNIYVAGSLPASEINRIYGLLPTTAVLITIDFRSNPGFAAADHSIAQAKGYTVTGA